MAEDPNISEKRKHDHIKMALESKIMHSDERFNYEPMFSSFDTEPIEYPFLRWKLSVPLWVSSMTGGTEKAKVINERLARSCGKFGFGMGLGSCRTLLESTDRLGDFDVKKYMPNSPLFANLGIAQVEQISLKGAWDQIFNLLDRVQADGLIVHINPLQEWLQTEGDVLSRPPIETIIELREAFDGLLIIKEVGQGFGPKSLETLYRMNIDAIELAGLGGTNFSKLEMLRDDSVDQYEGLSYIGHTVSEMIEVINSLPHVGDHIPDVIISGGIKGFLDGYYYCNRLKSQSIYGQASRFLKYALLGQEELDNYIQGEIAGWNLCRAYLHIRERD